MDDPGDIPRPLQCWHKYLTDKYNQNWMSYNSAITMAFRRKPQSVDSWYEMNETHIKELWQLYCNLHGYKQDMLKAMYRIIKLNQCLRIYNLRKDIMPHITVTQCNPSVNYSQETFDISKWKQQSKQMSKNNDLSAKLQSVLEKGIFCNSSILIDIDLIEMDPKIAEQNNIEITADNEATPMMNYLIDTIQKENKTDVICKIDENIVPVTIPMKICDFVKYLERKFTKQYEIVKEWLDSHPFHEIYDRMIESMKHDMNHCGVYWSMQLNKGQNIYANVKMATYFLEMIEKIWRECSHTDRDQLPEDMLLRYINFIPLMFNENTCLHNEAIWNGFLSDYAVKVTLIQNLRYYFKIKHVIAKIHDRLHINHTVTWKVVNVILVPPLPTILRNHYDFMYQNHWTQIPDLPPELEAFEMCINFIKSKQPGWSGSNRGYYVGTNFCQYPHTGFGSAFQPIILQNLALFHQINWFSLTVLFVLFLFVS